MYQTKTLNNGLTLITIDIPRLNSLTTLVSVGAGSRYETKRVNGISHFLEHMFFKGSKKYPSHEIIANLIDGIGAVNNAATSKEFTFYWIKSADKHINLASDVISSMLADPLFEKQETEREKGVIAEELRMYRDMPSRYIFDLFENLLFGDQPLGWDLGGKEEITNKFNQKDFIEYVNSLYSPDNMSLVYAGKLPKNIEDLAEEYFTILPKRAKNQFKKFQPHKQTGLKINIFNKKIDQAHIVLGVNGYDRYDKKRHVARLLGVILGEGMSSRLFIEVRERRGLAYHVSADHDSYKDTGAFAIYAGLKLEKVTDGLKVIKEQIDKIKSDLVSDEELKKAKEIIKGRLAIRSESTNFLAEHFGCNFVLDRKLESFEEYMEHIDSVTSAEIKSVAIELFNNSKLNLQIIGPFKSETQFVKTLR